MKKFLLDNVGARGLLQMIQAFIYASICVFFHTVMFPELIGVLPIAILIGIIALQPTYGITKKVIPKIGLAFALACFVIILSTLLLPISVYTYYFVMIVVILAVNFIMPQKYMVMTLAIATAIYFLGVSGDEPMPLYLLAIIALFDVFLFFIIVRLVVRFVHLPLEKTIQTIMNQLIGLFSQEIESVFTKNEKFITKPLHSIFVQAQMFIKEYSAGKKANPHHVELYKDLLPCYLALFFHMQTMEDIGRAGLSEEAKHALSKLNIKVSNQINQKEVDPVASFHVKKFVENFLIIKAGMAELAQGGNGK
ncbi:hypothetical protein [Listeria seeligeri]|uniref:hypothetical protein n=1 Tax=Listeria seeligeri TaxID=1640 RepID=UPI0018887BC7|nr:hypothetical protein [Listeria seeligeri]MBF2671652.1 hypothetical protein [Listeria seeligeri]